MSISQKVKDDIMRNLRGTIFYMKINVLEDFYVCISVLSGLGYDMEVNDLKNQQLFPLDKGPKLIQSCLWDSQVNSKSIRKNVYY